MSTPTNYDPVTNHFDTTYATTGEPQGDFVMCDNFGNERMYKDIWYKYVAPCSGTLTVSTCDLAGFDTRLAVYDGPPCEGGHMLACNDDGPGCVNYTSILVMEVTEGAYIVRLGSFNPDDGGGGRIWVECVEPSNDCLDPLPDCPSDINGDDVTDR